MKSDLYPRIYACVRAVPERQISTYGAIAKMVGCGPRQVGYALSSLPQDTDVPWHRVVNREGRISVENPERQRKLLEQEGVIFNQKGRIDLDRFGWNIADF